MNIEAALLEFIASKLITDGTSSGLAPDTPLLSGVLDSVNILRLVVFIEERFGIQVQDEELVPENFQSVATLTAYVERKSAPVR
jgi:acyl carrier protein